MQFFINLSDCAESLALCSFCKWDQNRFDLYQNQQELGVQNFHTVL